MISNYKKTSQKPTQINTCLNKSIKPKSSFDSIKTLDRKTSRPIMSSLTADIRAAAAAASAAKTSTVKSPTEEVVVNSIIYSKPSFCSIVVDLGGSLVGEVPGTKDKMPKSHNSACPYKLFSNQGLNPSPMGLKPTPLGFATACLAGFASPPPSMAAQPDAQVYRMCTTMNGSIHHQISDLCDNILAMAGFFGVASDEHDDDDDDLIEFAYDDGDYKDEHESEDEDDEEETDDDDDVDVEYDNEYDYYLDADKDIVDFSYERSAINAPNLNCDKRKKVRFNTKPMVHVMHKWDYAYRAARKGEWEMFARDRERFRLRVQRSSLLLNPILEREHRQKIYEKRFANLYENNDDQKQLKQIVKIEAEVKTNSEKIKTAVEPENVEKKTSHTDPKNSYQKKKRKRRRFCKMGNKHYF